MPGEKLTPEVEACKNAFLSGKTMSDRDTAKAALTVIDGYRWLPYPTRSKEIQEYYKYTDEQRKKMNAHPEDFPEFWKNKEVQEYFDAVHKIKTQNKDNQEWLEWMKSVLEPSDHPAIDAKLAEFKPGYVKKIDQPDWRTL